MATLNGIMANNRRNALEDECADERNIGNSVEIGHGVDSLRFERGHAWLLYTSDAADDLLRVDPGGRRLHNKKLTLIYTSRI